MSTKLVPFVIDHLDPLAQGVSKRTDKNKKSTITFIPKTLPGEQGHARIIKAVKGVEFAELNALEQKASNRTEADCPHYAKCSGCDYLHVSYQDEIIYKKDALQFLLRALPIEKIEIEAIAAENRFYYRNRVQLHYRHKYLGFIDANSDQVLEVPNCLLVSPAIKKSMDSLYEDKSWSKDYEGRGHVELYERDGSVLQAWNQPYADGGFTQVNQAMNHRLKACLGEYFKNKSFNSLLDVFSGDGNLSSAVFQSNELLRFMVDVSPWHAGEKPENYYQKDLYDADTLASIARQTKLKKVDLLLLDPPRKGFPLLADWVNKFSPKTIAYISCNPATLARDLQALFKSQKKKSYKIEKITLLDMFPGTKHFETIVILRAKV